MTVRLRNSNASTLSKFAALENPVSMQALTLRLNSGYDIEGIYAVQRHAHITLQVCTGADQAPTPSHGSLFAQFANRQIAQGGWFKPYIKPEYFSRFQNKLKPPPTYCPDVCHIAVSSFHTAVCLK